MTGVALPSCPVCKNTGDFYIVRQISMTVEDSQRPRTPIPVGAGTTSAAFDLVQLRGCMVVCRSCGVMFFDNEQYFKVNE